MSAKRNEVRYVAKPFDPEMFRARKAEERPVRRLGDPFREDPEPVDWSEARSGQHGLDVSRVLCRDLEAGGNAGNLVGSKSPITPVEYLGAALVVARAGGQVVPIEDFGPVPRVSGVTAAGWIGESGGVTEPNFTFDSIPSSVKTAAAFADVSRMLNAQSPLAEGIVGSELMGTVSRAVDAAVLVGAGVSGEPTGITTTTGIGSTSGATFSQTTAAELLRLVEAGNGTPTAFILSPATAKLLRTRQRFTGSDTPILSGGMIADVPAFVTTGMPDDLIVAGDFREVTIAVRSIEILRNPFSQARAGFVEIGVYWVGDVIVRHPAAFAIATSVS